LCTSAHRGIVVVASLEPRVPLYRAAAPCLWCIRGSTN
jgi:hypothetical protein